MTVSQKIVLGIGLVLFVLAGLFPTFISYRQSPKRPYESRRRFLFQYEATQRRMNSYTGRPETMPNAAQWGELNCDRLFLEWTLIAVPSAAVWLMLKPSGARKRGNATATVQDQRS